MRVGLEPLNHLHRSVRNLNWRSKVEYWQGSYMGREEDGLPGRERHKIWEVRALEPSMVHFCWFKVSCSLGRGR